MSPDDLKRWRKERFHTQSALANMLGVTKTCVFRWESGARNIPPFLHLALGYLELDGDVKTGVAGMKDKVTK